MHEVNWIDYGIMGLMGLSVLMGIIRGFVREALSLFTWVAAIGLGILYCELLAQQFTSISIVGVRLTLAFVLIVLAVLITGGIISHFIVKLIKLTGFGVTDRVVGTFFGAGRAIAVIGLLIVFAEPSIFATTPMWKDSHLLPKFLPASEWLKKQMPEEFLVKMKALST